uniref:Putative S-RNase n=1 Tax=Coffea canephora TaxID=49390 RepID=H1ZS23_COFCA|nr:putative S-RNase [Coffea canephora]
MGRSLLILILVMFVLNAQKSCGQYEFFRLVTFWGPSFCRMYQCWREPPVPKFTLHGLWPDNYTRHLYNCGGTRYVPLRSQRSIDARDDYWYDYFLLYPPSARGNWRTEQRFWAKEWRNHGTCSETVFNQQNYFNLAKTLMFMYDLKSILFNPINQIPWPWPRVSDVQSAIFRVTRVRTELRCHYYKNGNMLVEIALCYDVTGNQVINCSRPGTVFCGKRSSRIYVPKNFK